MIGKTLRFYRIESKLGAGGMGVVYKAVDSRLDRTAAIKVLSASAVSGDREKRFIQEAKTASSLNHPNIVTIYDIDTQEIDGKAVHLHRHGVRGRRNARSLDRAARACASARR